ncbi:Phosphoglycolate phosphatase [hydrothermal vent metagenome]|uniref:phosphoglycolate phosphatase n=1 Tax=hydrothermal vent metagenome TaxID=652676 RepID=A0A1W1D153_9ZZZZ
MKLSPKQLLIFDLDGTLINSALDLGIAINTMLAKLGRDSFEDSTIHHWVGNGAEMLVKRALSASREIDEDLEQELVEEALEIFLDSYENNLANATVAYAGVKSTLQYLKSQAYTLAIVTNKPFRFVQPILESLDLDNIFELVLGGDSLEEKKPHPEPLLYVCDTFDISIEESLMIGDSKNDILSANACEMDSVAVTYGYNYGEDIRNYTPSLVIDNFAELLKYLDD